MNKSDYKILDLDYGELSYYLINESLSKRVLISYFNFNTALLANKNPVFASELGKNFVVHNDGIGAYIFSSVLFGNTLKHNVNGSNLYPFLIDKLLKSGKKIFVVFSHNNNKDDVELLIQKLFENNISLIDFAVHNGNNEPEITAKIRRFSPDAVFAGLGQPHQEEWVMRNKELLQSGIMICSGSGFEFILNRKKRAPAIFQKTGLEWFYRLLQEPARLWKRYIIGIPVFLFYIYKQKFNL